MLPLVYCAPGLPLKPLRDSKVQEERPPSGHKKIKAMNKTYVNKVEIRGVNGLFIRTGAVWVAGKNRYQSANGEVFYYYVPKDVMEPDRFILPSAFVENNPDIFEEQEVLMSAEEVVKYIIGKSDVYHRFFDDHVVKSIKVILEK